MRKNIADTVESIGIMIDDLIGCAEDFEAARKKSIGNDLRNVAGELENILANLKVH